MQERAHKHAMQRVLRADAFALEHKRVNDWDLSDAMATFAAQYRQELRQDTLALHVPVCLSASVQLTLWPWVYPSVFLRLCLSPDSLPACLCAPLYTVPKSLPASAWCISNAKLNAAVLSLL